MGLFARTRMRWRGAGWEIRAESLIRDLSYGARTLRKEPQFTLAAVLTLALGIGASTIIFSVVDSVLLRPFPYKNADRLVTFAIHFHNTDEASGRSRFGAPEFLGFKRENQSFEDMLGVDWVNLLYSKGEETRRISGGLVTPNTFEILGVHPMLGRPITEEDGKPEAPPVFAMSYELWSTTFGRDQKVIGATLDLSGEPKTLVAVMPPRFRFADCDVWIPAAPAARKFSGLPPEEEPSFWPVGVLKPGVSIASAAADLDRVAEHLSKTYPAGYLPGFKVAAESLREFYVGRTKKPLMLLSAAVGLLLLIACSNVANLLLARSTAREKEMMVRVSLGASRARLIRQLLIESFLLAGVACGVGAQLAYWGLKAIPAVIPVDAIPSEAVIALKPVALWFSLTMACFVALLCGSAPALVLFRSDLSLRMGHGNAAGARGSGRVRNLLVSAEVALSLLLLIGSGLMIRTLTALQSTHLGFDPTNLLFARLQHAGSYASAEQKKLFFRRIVDRVEAIPGVQSATVALTVPPYSTGITDVAVAGEAEARPTYANSELCSEDYFRTMRQALLRGRLFTRVEIESARTVVVVNEAFARNFFPKGGAVGQHVRFPAWERNYSDWPKTYLEIIGVVADVKNQSLRNPTMAEIYLPYTISTTGLTDADGRGIMVRTTSNPEAMWPSLRAAVHDVDPSVATTDVDTVTGLLRAYSYAEPRFLLITLGAFASIGLVLVTVGVFSVMAYTVTLRRHEIGVRMAVGAQAEDIVRLVLTRGALLVAAGILVGTSGSAVFTRLLVSQIWGISRMDPLTIAMATVCILAAGFVASWLPARRAARLDPSITLRHE